MKDRLLRMAATHVYRQDEVWPGWMGKDEGVMGSKLEMFSSLPHLAAMQRQ